ncbi:UNVERIFIED_CONTAM: hypothetical protein GTU68_064343 [Idotea baltica]|nr:hypothetical protein [Idotea baltica]
MDKAIKNPVLILAGDVPLINSSTIEKMMSLYQESNAKLLCLGFKAKNPTGYGRLVSFQEDIIDIVEEKDATGEQREITLCNSGIYLVDGELLASLVKRLKNNNNAKEYYITDIVKLTNADGHRCVVHVTKESEVMGVNDKIQLAEVEKLTQRKLRKMHLKNGVTMIDPNSVFLSEDTVIGRDVRIHPNVIIGEKVKIEDGVEILPFSHLANCVIGDKCKVGNFVEIKASDLDDGVKSSHLSYIGDAKIGSNSNIGAGTIFCNYDGYVKHKSNIGKNVFIGSNSALVSPITIGDRAIIGAGSVVTEDVPNNTLTIARARQSNYEQRADLIRERKKAK